MRWLYTWTKIFIVPVPTMLFRWLSTMQLDTSIETSQQLTPNKSPFLLVEQPRAVERQQLQRWLVIIVLLLRCMTKWHSHAIA